MQCGVKRKRCQSTSEFDIEQQHTLFDTSMMKLHQEHMRHGLEPRLMRFVLINNALKLLQMHMLRLEEEDALGSLDYDGSSNRFFANTFKHGRPTPMPLSPLTSPAKSLKLEQSQLMAATPFQAPGEECVEEEQSTRAATTCSVLPTSEDRRAVNSLATVVNQSCSSSHVSKHHIDESEGGEDVRLFQTPPAKKPCQDSSRLGNGLTSTSGLEQLTLEHSTANLDPTASTASTVHLDPTSSTDPTVHLDLTPSTDFAKVDTAMYDYDVPGGSSNAPPPSRPCTMQAIGTPVVQNGDTTSYAEGREGSESPPEPSAESDFLDELDHIVNLLMT